MTPSLSIHLRYVMAKYKDYYTDSLMHGQILHIGFDDTDSRAGRCTTHLAFEIARYLGEKKGAAFLDYPLLIRLNPNIPWKTRGNGALCLRLIVNDGVDVANYVRQAVQAGSAIGSGANPGVVFFSADERNNITIPSLVQEFSAAAMHDVMSRQMAENVAQKCRISYSTFGNGQGLVGALAALGCLLDQDHSFELIAYRRKENCGSPRQIDKTKVVRLNKETYPDTFCNYDAENDRIMIGPHGPDPVFVGIRGEGPNAVRKAIAILEPEEKLEGWAIFRSNQGTNMHLRNVLDLRYPKAYSAGFLRCTVASRPIMTEGGHLFFSVAQNGAEMTAAAYEPTGLSKIASLLEPGDNVEIGCGVRKGTTKHSKVLNIEYLSVLSLAEVFDVVNPPCPNCGKHMKSEGAGKGFKCKRCRVRNPNVAKMQILKKRQIRQGLYLPAIKAHRHLSKPLQRYGREKKYCDWAGSIAQWEVLHCCTSECVHMQTYLY